ncbi:MAG TPA: RagB/SusD family nutrient uptake outer membrane protein [Flavisolibacter sp.]|nr:RagB/SusD family nutrient uptake outer membrane protein [Flavisolibacter sp.]
MNQLKKYIVGVAILFSAAACQKRLDINPTQSIDASKALLTSSDVEAAMVGAYSDLGDANVYGGDMFVYSELLADFNEINWSGTFQGLTQIYNKAIPVDNAFVANTWLDSYKVINDVNNVLSALDVVLAAKKNRVEGEAKFIRGSVYFDLVRLYAKPWNQGDPTQNDGVPLVLTPTRAPLDAQSQKARDKVAAVYTQVIKDLTEAESLLPATNSFFANKYAAAAMLARVYLQKGDYTNAAAAANRVISSGKYQLEETYAEVFPFNPDNANEDIGSPGEYIFSMQVTSSQGVNDFDTYFSPIGGRGDIDIRDEHLALYEPNDDRLNLFYDDGGVYRTGKFDMLYGNVPIIRLAEMYLIRAEANFRLGTSVGATPVSDINTIRARVGLDPYTAGTLTLANILRERKLELAFEGQALHDIKRLQGSVGPLPWNSPKLVLPIPSRERTVNSNLTQNEGY